ncbi:MAG: ribonuclease PH [Candidatus Hydrothermales bacterium]
MREKEKREELRRIVLKKGEINAEGSVYVEAGKTKVMITVSIENKVPQFLKGTGEGWIKAYYWMHPRAVDDRKPIEMRIKDKRSIELSRIISRVLRGGVDRKKIGEYTLLCDVEVLQADGSTRALAITGASCAIYQALNFMKKNNLIKEFPDFELVCGITVGKMGNEIYLDLSYEEDHLCEFDLNLFFTESGKILEIQGTSERRGIDINFLNLMIERAREKVVEIFEIQREFLKKYPYAREDF